MIIIIIPDAGHLLLDIDLPTAEHAVSSQDQQEVLKTIKHEAKHI